MVSRTSLYPRLNRLNQLVVGGGKVVEGAWRMGPGHRVEYLRRGLEEQVVVRGRLLDARPLGLVFQTSEESADGEVRNRLLTLRGRWEADADNRLVFAAQRQRGRRDRLILQGGWEVGPQSEILYRFEEEALPSGRRWRKRRHAPRRSGRRRTRLLRFRGYWDITDRSRLTFVLDKRSDSLFRFRGAFQTPVVHAKAGEIRYQLGGEVAGGVGGKTITLFGAWKLSRRLELRFEVPYGRGKVRRIDFQASYAVGPRGNLTARLMTRQGEPLGVEVVLTRSLLGDGEAFVRLRKAAGEAALEGGGRVRW